jgi:hypothetical protein
VDKNATIGVGILSDPIRDDPITGAEEALFQRLLRRLGDVKQSAAGGAGTAASAAADVAGSAASKVGYAAGAVGNVAGDAAGQIAEYAKNAADFVQKYPGVLAVGAIGPAAPIALLAITALTARKIVESRRSGQEPIAQLLFRAISYSSWECPNRVKTRTPRQHLHVSFRQ